ncbi:MAG: nucleoside triphosphate pyrophosphohydrolase [Thiothrix sp.]|nr:nucleoside triphosphate pyrophosphohydrolase [Thiothrix sp.]HPQ94713.1 nucleoside triphosphate pyrophosphohydrolase [Thiolinea sp.]
MPEAEQAQNAMQQLLVVMQRLRDPIGGCPWDLAQSFRTILPYTLEEVYEVADAVDRNDAAALCDELGDLLLQVVFMAQIASDQGLFDFEAVAQGIATKMIRRHPHVFADTVYADVQARKQDWEAIKQQERQEKAQHGFFAGIPAAMPALRRSQKVQKRAAQVGFDWDDWRPVIPKIVEELTEVTEAVENGEPFERIEEEVGDVLMGAANLARQLGVNAENALRLANAKFERRFESMAAWLTQQGLSLETATLAQMEAAWQAVKQQEKRGEATGVG